MDRLNVGDKVDCFWGRWRLDATVTKITKQGNVYAKRWNKKRQCWTTERKIEPHRGIWRVV